MPENLKSLFKVLTVNCQGLGDSKKRKDVFMYLKAKSFNIYFLQDTHLTKQDKNVIKSQWGSKNFYSAYKPNSRSVAILVNDNCEEKEVQKFKSYYYGVHHSREYIHIT